MTNIVAHSYKSTQLCSKTRLDLHSTELTDFGTDVPAIAIKLIFVHAFIFGNAIACSSSLSSRTAIQQHETYKPTGISCMGMVHSIFFYGKPPRPIQKRAKH